MSPNTSSNRFPFTQAPMHARMPNASPGAQFRVSIIYVKSSGTADSPHLRGSSFQLHYDNTHAGLEHSFIELLASEVLQNLMSALNGVAPHNPSQSFGAAQGFAAQAGAGSAHANAAPPTDAPPPRYSAPPTDTPPRYSAPPNYAPPKAPTQSAPPNHPPPETPAQSAPPTNSPPPAPDKSGNTTAGKSNDVPRAEPKTPAVVKLPKTVEDALDLFGLGSNAIFERDHVEALYTQNQQRYSPESIRKRYGIDDEFNASDTEKLELRNGAIMMSKMDAARKILLEKCAADESKPKAESAPSKAYVSKSERRNALQVLGFPPDITPTSDQVKEAYKKLARQFHPDRNVNLPSGEQAQAEESFKALANARDLLLGSIG